MIGPDQAVAVARARAEANRWFFSEPVRCELRRGWFGSESRYEIETNAGRRGTKARFVIEVATGKVLEEGYMPR